MLVALVVAQRLGVEVEPFGAEAHQLLFCRRGTGSFRRRGLGRRAAPQHRADPRHQFPELARLCDVVVGAELEPNDAVDRARGRRQHDDGDIDATLEVADDRKPVFLGHVEVEHHEIGRAALDGAAQAFAAIAQRHVKAVHLEVIADHLAGRRLIVDDDDMRTLGHDVSVAGSVTVKVDPRPGPALSAVTWPPCMSMIRLTIESPRPVELSPAVGFADSRWKRPNKRPRSSGDSPAPSSAMRITVLEPSWVTPTMILPPIGEYLMALLTRLSIASRMRSESHMVTKFGGAETAMVCCLLTAEGRFASVTSATRDATSTGSRRMVMSKASAIASEIRWSTIEVSRLVASRICSTWAVTFSLGEPALISSVSISVRPRITPSGFFKSCATVPRISFLKPLARCSRSHCADSRRLACISARVRWATRSSSWVLAACSCWYRITLSNAIDSRLEKISTSARSVSDSWRSACSSTTTSRPEPVRR